MRADWRQLRRAAGGLKVPRRTVGRRTAIGAAVAVLLSSAAVTGAQASPPTTAIRYDYDAAGQLTAVDDPSSETAFYSWDPAGNLLSIARHPSNALSIIQLTPAQGNAGTTVTINGTGFSTTPSADTVKFNGTGATVTAATAVTLTVVVPSSATSGSVSVQTESEGPATSGQSFTISNASPPTISSVSTAVAVSNAEATISGTHFEPNVANDLVVVNQSRPEVVSASTSAIKFKVPTVAGGGHIYVSTPEGTATGPDLYIPPRGLATSTVGFTERLASGASVIVNLPTAGKVGLVLFDGTAGQRVSLALSESTMKHGHASLWGPEGNKVQESETSFGEGTAGSAADVATLPVSGTFTALVEPEGTATGSVKLTLPTVVTSTITPSESGGTQTVTTSAVGQKAEVTFKGSEGERIFLETPETSYPTGCCSLEVALETPDGTVLANSYMKAKSTIETQTLPSSGTYTLFVNPATTATGTVTLKAYVVPPNATATVTPSESGASRTIKTTVPGQNGELTFSGTTGERVFVETPESSYPEGCCNVEVAVETATGTVLASGYVKSKATIDTVTLPSTGAYRLFVNPMGATTGTITLKVYEVPADFSGVVTPSEAGGAKTVTTSVPGQNGEVTLSGTSGERIFINSAESTYPSGCCTIEVAVKTPAGTTLTHEYLTSSHTYIDTQTLTTAGTYTIVVNPQGAATGSIALKVYEVPVNISKTIAIEGAPVTFATTVPGQNAELTFSGTASKKIRLTASEVTVGTSGCCSTEVSVEKPGGGTLVTPKFIGTSGGKIESTLTVAGTYKIYVNPVGAGTGSMKLTLTDPPGPARPAIGRRRAGSHGRDSTHRRTRRGAGREATISGPAIDAPSAGSAQSPGAAAIPHAAIEFRPRDAGAWAPPHDSHSPGGWETGLPASPWAKIARLQAREGVTALTGVVLAQNGLPLRGIKVALEDTYLTTKTDGAGRFLLRGAPAGHRVLVVEAGTPRSDARYGAYEVGVNVAQGKTTSLPFTIWLTPLAGVGDAHVSSPTKHETRISTPQIPGLEVRLPAGTVVTDAAGHTVHKLNITAIPLDRPPFPLPSFVEVPLYFTIQPGRAYLSKGAQIIYPNWNHLPPGQRVDFWD